MHLIIDQQIVLFYKRVLNSSNVVLQTLLCLKQISVNSLTSLYNIRSLNVLDFELAIAPSQGQYFGTIIFQ